MLSYILATIWYLMHNFESIILMQECIYIKPNLVVWGSRARYDCISHFKP